MMASGPLSVVSRVKRTTGHRPQTTDYMEEIIYKIAETAAERQGYFAARHAVFVEEQGLFTGTDVDEHDDAAIHIIAITRGSSRVVGAVRCYPAADDVWYGGRLAVLQTYRHHAAAIGASLCRLAEATVIERGCRRFLAYIQLQNVRFFQRLGWHAQGEPVIHCGAPHLLMAASLAKASVVSRQLSAVGTAEPLNR
jgi:putative N-acetyltransferase (TIGR04045 family)